jgi:acyl carrier protein
MGDLRERLVRCFAAVFAGLSEPEVVKATPASVGTWDSLATVSLLSVVEEEFGLQVPPEDFENFVSFELILDYLQSRQKKHVS